jgi:hypothetical protein
MTWKPNNSPHTGRVLLCLTPRKHNRCTHEWKQCCFFFFQALCNIYSLLKVRQSRFFIWTFWDICRMQYEGSNLKCGLQKTGLLFMGKFRELFEHIDFTSLYVRERQASWNRGKLKQFL